MQRDRIKKGLAGFTIIELLVVVAIIAILATIGFTQFAVYKTRAYNSTAESDLVHLRTVLEAYYADNERYPDL